MRFSLIIKPQHFFRIIYVLLGCLSLALGIIGIVLPLLPTTPFLLFSAFCFARGSARMYKWLLSQRYIGTVIMDWENSRIIRLPTKIYATVIMAVILSAPMLFSQIALGAKVLSAIIGIFVLFFIWSCQSS